MDVIGKINEMVRDAMSTDVASVSPATPVDQVAALMAGRRVKRVPVLEAGPSITIYRRMIAEDAGFEHMDAVWFSLGTILAHVAYGTIVGGFISLG